MADIWQRRTDLQNRWGSLQSERASWKPHWQEISTYLMPRNGRFFVQDRNRGDRRHNNIYDSTGTRALRIQAAGMMAGATSPARPWFRLGTADPDLNKYDPVSRWLFDMTRRMQAVFAKSNTYRMLHNQYEELGAFGTGCSTLRPHPERVIHHYPATVGEYAIATNYQGIVDTMYREFQLTVAQVVKEWGLENCTPSTQNLYRNGTLDAWVTVVHAIEPREDRDITKSDRFNMPWRSCYFEVGSDPGKYLSEGGFERFPVLAPRWAVVGGDVYGHCPAMEALGDVKQLQHQQLRKAQAIDYQTKPPLQAPTSMKSREIETLPGGVTFVDSANPQAGIRPSWEVGLNLQHLLADIQDVRQRINSCFHADLFLMLANATDTRMTATEVAERHEEKLLMLGPVLDRLHNELLEPLIDLTFDAMLRSGQVPPIPQELSGMDLNVEFISMLAQAQQAIGTNSFDRFTVSLGAVAQMKPDVLDKFNADEWVDAYSQMLGINPNIIVPSEQVARVRESRNAAMAAKEQAAMAQQQSQAVANVAKAAPNLPMQPQDVMGMFSGYVSPTALELG